jgi:hypothetical protein
VRWGPLCALLTLTLGSGCKKSESAHERESSVAAPIAARAAPDAGLAAKTKRAGARPVHAPPRVKSVSADVPDVAADAALPASDVVLAAGQELVLDFSAGARVHALGPAILRSAVAELDALLVRDATLSVDLPPAAATPDSGFLLSTPSAAFSLVRNGCFVLRSLANGNSVAWVVSGSVTLRAAGPAFREGEKPLGAGERVEVRLDGSVLRSRHTAQTLEQAEQAARVLREPKPKDAAFASLDQSLRASLEELQREKARERELTAAHRAALTVPGPERMALQAQLSAHAAILSRARRRLETALAQRAASRLSTARGVEDRLSGEARMLLEPSP